MENLYSAPLIIQTSVIRTVEMTALLEYLSKIYVQLE